MPTLTFMGHSAFLLKGESTTILFDPFITDNPKAPVESSEIKTDYILVSHGHADHLGDTVVISLRNQATVIAVWELSRYLRLQKVKTQVMNIGGTLEFSFGKVKMTPALHSSAVKNEDGTVTYVGNPCGFIVTLDEKTVYFAGDTGLFSDMKLVGELDPIDVALVPISGGSNMDSEDAARAVEFLAPQITIPMHYNTWEHLEVDVDRFVQLCEGKGNKVQVLEPGERLDF